MIPHDPSSSALPCSSPSFTTVQTQEPANWAFWAGPDSLSLHQTVSRTCLSGRWKVRLSTSVYSVGVEMPSHFKGWGIFFYSDTSTGNHSLGIWIQVTLYSVSHHRKGFRRQLWPRETQSWDSVLTPLGSSGKLWQGWEGYRIRILSSSYSWPYSRWRVGVYQTHIHLEMDPKSFV